MALKKLFGGKDAGAVPSAWILDDWGKSDLRYVPDFVGKNCSGWEYYALQLCLVPCAKNELKPAIFIKVGQDYEQWTQTVELRTGLWSVVSSDRYVCLGFSAFFEDPTGGIIGIAGVPGEWSVVSPETQQYKLACSTLLDPLMPEVEEWIFAWTKMQGVTVIFFVLHNRENLNYFYFTPSPEAKSNAFEKLYEAKAKIQGLGPAISNFQQEHENLSQILPSRKRWKRL